MSTNHYNMFCWSQTSIHGYYLHFNQNIIIVIIKIMILVDNLMNIANNYDYSVLVLAYFFIDV